MVKWYRQLHLRHNIIHQSQLTLGSFHLDNSLIPVGNVVLLWLNETNIYCNFSQLKYCLSARSRRVVSLISVMKPILLFSRSAKFYISEGLFFQIFEKDVPTLQCVCISSYLTHMSQMKFPLLIKRTSPFSVLRVIWWYFSFLFKSDAAFCGV